MKATNKLKMKKLNQGITLVSLVVTIIILIILAGISINLTLGEEGIFTLAQRAKENMELAQIEEQEKLNTLYTEFDFNTEGEGVTGGLYDAIGEFRKFKEKIAQAIQDAGGIPPENPILADADAFKERIVGEKGIVAEVTKNATATPEDIAKGKTAWVKGKQITGINKSSTATEILTQEQEFKKGVYNKTTTISVTPLDVEGYKCVYGAILTSSTSYGLSVNISCKITSSYDKENNILTFTGTNSNYKDGHWNVSGTAIFIYIKI